MNTRFLSIFLMLPVSLFAQVGLDQVFYSSLSAPADREVFFARGLPNEPKEADLAKVSWSGLGAGVKVDKPLEEGITLASANFAMGPLNPDSRSSFILSGSLPVVVGTVGEKRGFINDLFGPSLAITGRGFFGQNSGMLENLELVFQLSTKLPGSASWSHPTEMDIDWREDSLFKGLLETNTAFLVGANFHAIPKVLRVSVFSEIMPAVRGFNQLQPLTTFLKSRTIYGLDRIFPPKVEAKNETQEPSKEVSKEAVESEKQRKDLMLGLLSMGVMTEASLKDEQFFVGVRFKSTKLTGFNDSQAKGRPGAKELTFFTRTNILDGLQSLSIADLGLSYTLVFDSSNWTAKKSVVGLCAKVKF